MVESFLPQNQLVTPTSQDPLAGTTTKTCEAGSAKTKERVPLVIAVVEDGPVLPPTESTCHAYLTGSTCCN